MTAKDIFGQARSFVSRSFIESRFHSPGARWDGRNFLTLNPIRPDGNIGSFSIRDDGVWFDFAADDAHKTGDVFDLLEAIEGRPAIEIAKEMIGGSFSCESSPRPAEPQPAAPIKADWKPIPEGVEPKFAVTPSNLTLYRSKDGDPMFFVARHEPVRPNEKKLIRPFYYDGAKFLTGLPPSLSYRPLYEFDSRKTVIVVEGEKKRAELEAFLSGRYSVTCWHGGAGAADKVWIEDLAGCDVILWPDADDVGRAAMLLIAKRIYCAAQKIRTVEPPNGVEKGWDAGDAIREGRDIDFFLQTAVEYAPPQEEEGDAPASASDPENIEDLEFPCTDLGNAERFVAMYGKVMRYNLEKKAWLAWDGRRWSGEDQSIITPMIKRVIRTMAVDGSIESAAFAKKSESRSSISAMLELASREPGIPVHEYELDQEPMLFACENGVIDLESGELMPHSRDRLISKLSPVAYNRDARCPTFMRFMSEIMLGRGDFVEFLQRWFGYSMSADTSAQSFAIFHGNGANGKSTLVEVIAKIMGAYGKAAPPDTFTEKMFGGSGIPNDIAALRGARYVLTTETEANARLAESKVKSMTGGDVVSARFMRGEFFEFTPTWKIIISTNHRPKISGADYGIWRRIILIPFDFFARPETADPRLPEKLWSEREGILAWMVEGAVKWHKDGRGRLGLKVSDEIVAQTQSYREDEDIIGRFISTACWQRGDPKLAFDLTSFKISGAELLRSFRGWAEKEGETGAAKITATGLGRALRERGYDRVHTASGSSYIGIVPKWDNASV